MRELYTCEEMHISLSEETKCKEDHNWRVGLDFKLCVIFPLLKVDRL
jgi:hypothetical protein